ncbi:MAG: proline--tRNA ligase [Myxococcales bacterium]|nr:proline--tRNA ligase [Myxococcales bacterium]
MKYSNCYIPTRKEDPADAEVVSHRLLIRAGFIRQLAAGVYSFLPLGWRVVRKVEEIVREEMNRSGAQEVLLPGVQPASLWEESGRWDHYGPELLRFKDRKGNDYCLGPTHEEVITDLVRHEVRSYKQLPLNLYQIQAKFRDEIRPRAGLMRGREFIMKDGYSFDIDLESSKASYGSMYDAYHRIFDRCGLAFRPVEADTGNIGGSTSHEFQVLADSGEDAIVSCSSCDYAANIEMAEIAAPSEPVTPSASSLTLVETPNARTIEEVTTFLGASANELVKTLIFVDADEEPFVVLTRGDTDVNEIKVKRALGTTHVRMATDEEVQATTGAPVGFAGPVQLAKAVPIYADHSLKAMAEAIVGANQKDKHYRSAVAGRDFEITQWVDIRNATEGDPCGRCGAPFEAYRGIEVGQVFHLGTKYSESMNATFLAPDGKPHPMIMGCYGIGVSRIVAAAIEQNHDERGIVWPASMAPFQLAIIPLNMQKSPEVASCAEELYAVLLAAGVDVLMDDRNERPGVKFADMELVGIPHRIVIGDRALADGKIEYKGRRDSESLLVERADILDFLKARL